MTEQTIGTVNVSGGNASIQLDTTDLPEGNYTIQAVYNQNNHYKQATASNTLTLTSTPTVDPLADICTLDNWGTFPHGTSGANQTGTPTAATSSDLTIGTDEVTTENRKYFVYNKTLQDFWDYYGNEFSLICHKAGGDGRYDLGFVNTTTNGYKLGYTNNNGRCYIRNQENNVNIKVSGETNAGEVLYNNYNEHTYKKVGSTLYYYYCQGGSNYVEKTLALGSIDASKYYLYMKGYNLGTQTLTNNALKINYHSRQS